MSIVHHVCIWQFLELPVCIRATSSTLGGTFGGLSSKPKHWGLSRYCSSYTHATLSLLALPSAGANVPSPSSVTVEQQGAALVVSFTQPAEAATAGGFTYSCEAVPAAGTLGGLGNPRAAGGASPLRITQNLVGGTQYTVRWGQQLAVGFINLLP